MDIFLEFFFLRKLLVIFYYDLLEDDLKNKIRRKYDLKKAIFKNVLLKEVERHIFMTGKEEIINE